MRTLSTRSAKASEITNGWIVVDAEGVVVGRLASFIALRLRGKHRADFTPHIDTGDHVVVINAEKVKLSGNKWQSKLYHHHTGFPGGIKEISADYLRENHPNRLIEKAVWRMLPHGHMGRQWFSKLKVYAGGEHPHTAQKPELVKLASN